MPETENYVSLIPPKVACYQQHSSVWSQRKFSKNTNLCTNSVISIAIMNVYIQLTIKK